MFFRGGEWEVGVKIKRVQEKSSREDEGRCRRYILQYRVVYSSWVFFHVYSMAKPDPYTDAAIIIINSYVNMPHTVSTAMPIFEVNHTFSTLHVTYVNEKCIRQPSALLKNRSLLDSIWQPYSNRIQHPAHGNKER